MTLETNEVDERQTTCLCALATNVKLTNEIGYQIQANVFEDGWAATLFHWIVDYTRNYEKPALTILPRMAQDRAGSIGDEDTASALYKYAVYLSTYYAEHASLFDSEKYCRDTVLAWVKERNLCILSNAVSAAVKEGNVKRAEEALRCYAEVKQVEVTATDFFHDVGRIISAYEEETGELLTLPGALGEMTGPLARGDLMCVLGESGTGKSWICLQIAMEGVKNGLRVCYVNNEISDRQMVRRVFSNMCGRPRERKLCRLPYFECAGSEYTDDGEEVPNKWRVSYTEKWLDPPDLNRKSVEMFLKRKRMSTNGGQFYLMSFAPKTLSVRDLAAKLDDLRDYAHFIPDILIVDYGDLMRPENTRDDRRNQIDGIYLGLRSLALDRDMLVISPTQANRAGYGRDVGKQNMAENIGNVNHSSIILGLNHTPVEKESGITRIKVLKNRDNKEYAEPAVCIGCLDIGQPIMASRRLHEVVACGGYDEED